MDNSTQEQLSPQQPDQPVPPTSSSFLKTLSIGIGVVGIGIAIGIGGYFLGAKSNKPMIQDSQKKVTVVSPTSTPDPTANWKTYTNTRSKYPYSFSYPSDWELQESDYLNFVSLDYKNGTVKITFSDGQYPYGFGGFNPGDFVKYDQKLTINRREYVTQEVIINNEKAYIDFAIEDRVNVLLGTGYPAADDIKASLGDYQTQKTKIIQILSTFKLTP